MVFWLEGVTVTAAKMNVFGDAKIDLSNGDRIEIFVTATDEGECWRFFLSEKSSINLIVNGLFLIVTTGEPQNANAAPLRVRCGRRRQ